MRRTFLCLPFLLLSAPAWAASLTVASVSGSCGSSVSVPVSVDSAAGLLAIEFRVAYDATRLTAGAATAGSAAAGFSISSNASGGVLRVAMASGTPAPAGSGAVAVLSFTIAANAPAGSTSLTISNVLLNDQTSGGQSGAVAVSCGGGGGGGGSAATWILPSSARVAGSGNAFYTTDLTVANVGTSDASVTLKFLGNNQDGRGGPERSLSLSAGRSTTLSDVLGSVFGIGSGFGAIQIKSSTADMVVLGQTATPAPQQGTFGQSVPAAGASALVTPGTSRSIVAVREDSAFRTNLVLANATEAFITIDVRLFSESGVAVGGKSYILFPLGMTQVSRVVRDMGFQADFSGGRLILSTSTAGGAFAAYASVIDAATNDPRTLLPQ